MFNFLFIKNDNYYMYIIISRYLVVIIIDIRIETKNIAIQCCISVLLQHYFPLLSVSSPVLIYHFPFQFFSTLGPTAVHCPCLCLFHLYICLFITALFVIIINTKRLPSGRN